MFDLYQDRAISGKDYWRINQDAPDPFIDSVPAMKGGRPARRYVHPAVPLGHLRQGADDREPHVPWG